MSARKEKKHMSDQATSGGASDDSAATAGAANSAASSGNPASVGAFGAKGSGLARGKRPSPQAAPAASTAPSGYQPSALEVLRPQSEYKNPFTGETSVPVVNEPAPQAAPIPIPAPAPVAPVARTAPAPAPKEPELFPFTDEVATKPRAVAPEPRAEINILPTEEVKRPAVSWGESNPPQAADSRPRRDDRPAFKPERREPRPFEPREPRQPRPAGEQREPREPRRDFNNDPRRREERADRPDRPVLSEPVKKPTGFFAWLKGLFSSSKTETNIAERPEAGNEEHLRHHRRRHRGGRGRGGYQGGQGGYQGGGENRGPRDGQPRDQNFEGNRPQQPDGEQSSEGQRYEGGGRRRRRGGRGRFRDDRGPRPEGQQGGGAI
ncbi:MAG: translation initiation factor [Verrucomicrobia bacterium]|nr:translation initiation factor [Verrucomicrobiota bacterium]